MVSRGELKPEDLAEIKKVFSLCDTDNSGSIDSNELATVMKSLSGVDPSPAELQQLLSKMDANRDGQIQWEEFVSSLTEWLGEENMGSSSSRKRKAPETPENARAKLHRRISRFFLQFKQSEDFARIRDSYSKSGQILHFTEDESMDADDNDPSPALDAVQKTAVVSQCEEGLKSLVQLSAALDAPSPEQVMKAVTMLSSMFAVCEAVSSPMERFKLGDLFLTLFQRTKEISAFARVAKFVNVVDNPMLQYQALRFISNYAPGPRVAHTPSESMLHPDKMLFKTEVIHANIVPQVVQLCKSPCIEVKEQAVVCLGRVASHNPDARDFVLNCGAMSVLIEQISDTTPDSILRKVVWTISVLCGHTHPRNRLPSYRSIQAAGFPLGVLVFKKDDEETLVQVCCALNYLLPGIVLEDNLSKRLVYLLGYPSDRVKYAILQVLVDMIRFDASCAKKLVGFNLLVECEKLLKSRGDYSVRLLTCELVAFIVEQGLLQDVIEANIIPALVNLLFHDEYARWKAVKVLSYASRGMKAHLTYLIQQQNLVQVLSQSLSLFKSYDSVLRDVYSFLGPSYNFKFVGDVVEALTNLAANAEPGLIRYFDLGVIEKIRAVQIMLVQELADRTTAVQLADQHDLQISLDEELRTLMQKIRHGYEVAKIPGTEGVVQAISETLVQFDAALEQAKSARANKDVEMKEAAFVAPNQPTSAFAPDVNLKLALGDDIRMIKVPSNVTLLDLNLRIRLRYGKQLALQYKDSEGDLVRVDSDDLLRDLLAKHLQSRNLNLKLWLSDHSSNAEDVWKVASASEETGQTRLLRDLERQTYFSKKDLQNLFHKFESTSSKGLVNKAQFRAGLQLIGVNDPVMVDQFFNAFDYSKDGLIDFREFVCGLSVMYKGSMEERLELAFKAYDLDGNGAIDRGELFHILKGNFNSKGLGMSDDMIRGIVEKCFQDADLDGNGYLDYDEFKSAVLKNKIAVQSFWANALG